jgi:hypothetical protein
MNISWFFSSDSQRGRAGEDSESAAQRDDFDARPGRGNVRISNARKSERPERGPEKVRTPRPEFCFRRRLDQRSAIEGLSEVEHLRQDRHEQNLEPRAEFCSQSGTTFLLKMYL